MASGEARSRGLRHAGAAYSATHGSAHGAAHGIAHGTAHGNHTLWKHERYAYVGYGSSYSGPYIESPLTANISAQDGGHAYIPCTVKRLGSKSVSRLLIDSFLDVGPKKKDGSDCTFDFIKHLIDIACQIRNLDWTQNCFDSMK